MGLFKKKKEEKINNSSTTTLQNVEKYLNEIEDIICLTDYDGNIEKINNPDIHTQYTSLKEILFEVENKDIYNEIMDKIQSENTFVKDIEVLKHKDKVNYYIIAFNLKEIKKIIFYIRNTSECYDKENSLIDEIERRDEHLKSKDLFIANLSHEIRTPINIIVGMIYFLKHTQLDDKQLEYVTKLDEASNLLLDIVNGILDLSKQNPQVAIDARTDFNFKNFLDGIIEMFQDHVKEKDLDFYVSLNIDPNVNVRADKARLSQIFINLIENAIKYTDKGFIELDGRKVEENNISYKLQFCLKDTGIGIKREDSLRIFREFSQVEDPTKTVKSGKGMGLAIAKKIVEDMDGKMWVESSMGLGSKFYFNFTIDKSNKTYEEIENGVEEVLEQHNPLSTSLVNDDIDDTIPRKILLVEDNDLNIEITTNIIKELNYICDVAKDGIEAIKKIKEVDKNYYDLILMDIHMPRYNGYEISKILKKDLDIKVPIVALTATTVTDQIVEENKQYIVDYILKPIKPAEFKDKIKSYMRNDKITTGPKKHLLLLGSDDKKINQLKLKLSNSFDLAVTKSELDAQILLESGSVDVLLIDEFEDLDN